MNMVACDSSGHDHRREAIFCILGFTERKSFRRQLRVKKEEGKDGGQIDFTKLICNLQKCHFSSLLLVADGSVNTGLRHIDYILSPQSSNLIFHPSCLRSLSTFHIKTGGAPGGEDGGSTDDDDAQALVSLSLFSLPQRRLVV